MSNIMIIYPRPNEFKQPRFGFSYDMMTIATIFFNEGHRVILKDFSCQDFNDEVFLKEITRESINLILVEFDSFSLKRSENNIHGEELVKAIKGVDSGICVAAYGHYCCITKKDIYSADVTITENGCNAVLHAINRMGILEYNIPTIADYDETPFINRNLLHQIEYFKKNAKSTLMITAEGCENTCVFCQRKGWQNRYQAHSDKYVLDEFKLLREQGYSNVWIVDENFTFNLNRARRILNLLVENGITEGMNLFISSWANIDIEFLDIAKKANIKVISFGLESGNQDILDFYKKNIDLEKAKAMVQYANKIGIFTVGNFIIGAPMETRATIDETFLLIQECAFDQINIKTLDYMIGSELFDGVREKARDQTHLFACAENGLNVFELKKITDLKAEFVQKYYQENKKRIEHKIKKFGFPYVAFL